MTLRFAPPVPDEFDDGTIDREDYLAEGALVILYNNDDIQSFALSAEYRHPELGGGGRGTERGRMRRRKRRRTPAGRRTRRC